jgi:hypothetical protein
MANSIKYDERKRGEEKTGRIRRAAVTAASTTAAASRSLSLPSYSPRLVEERRVCSQTRANRQQS